MIQQLKRSLRTHFKNPALAAMAVLMLAVGIGSNTAVFSTLNAVLLRQLPFHEPDRLIMGRVTRGERVGTNISGHDYLDYRDQAESFSSLAAMSSFTTKVTVGGEGGPERIDAGLVTVDLFPTLGVSPQLGRHFLAAEGEADAESVIMLSHGLWRSRFAGDPEIVGKTVAISGTPCTVIGVMPSRFHFLYDAQLWVNLCREGPLMNARRFHNLQVVGRLGDGVSRTQAQQEVDAISKRLGELYPESNAGKGMLVAEMQSTLTQNHGPQTVLLMAAVGLVLAIACANLAGLLLARGISRRRELAVRAALGASRGRLVRDMVMESLVLAGIGGTLGVVFAVWLQRYLPVLLHLDSLGIQNLGLELPVLGFAVAASLLTGVLFGLIPALRVTAGNLACDLRSGSWRDGSGGGSGTRKVLVIAQVGLSVLLLIGSGLLIKSLLHLANTDLGFSAENLISAEITLAQQAWAEEAAIIEFYSGLLEEMRAQPGVTAAALITQLPLRDPGNDIYVWTPDNPPTDHANTASAYTRTVFPGYFEAMGTPLVAGRDLDRGDREDTTPALVINQRMAADLFPAENPLRRQVVVDTGGDEPVVFEVVGVAADARISYVGQPPYRAMYHSFFQFPKRRMRIAVRTDSDPSAVVGILRGLVQQRDRNVPVSDIATMESVIGGSIAPQRVLTLALTVFSGIALLLAVIGLYGVLAHDVNQRVFEFGVRAVLGAKGADLIRIVLTRGLVLVSIGLALGMVAGLFLTRLLGQLLFEVTATDPWTYVLVVVLFVSVALLACLLPARRASRVDPAVALRTE